MVKLIFIDGEYEYYNYITIFFETLKNHIEDFGCLSKIDLTGIEIRKEEFDEFLNIVCNFVRNNEITKIFYTERQNTIKNYLGLLLEHDYYIFTTTYCAMHGYLDILKFVHRCGRQNLDSGNSGHKLDNSECQAAAQYGHVECLEYLHENDCKWDAKTCEEAAKNGHLHCLKYLHENKCEFGKYTCYYAALYGHLPCLKYAYENDCQTNTVMWRGFAKGDCAEYLNSLH